MAKNSFTPEQISQILEEFFKVVGTRQYIGARYVPIFGRKGEDSIEWDNTGTYEPLTIVLNQGNSYTSRQFVPIGVDIADKKFWALTGNFNAQVEQYRRETAQALATAEDAQKYAEGVQDNLTTLGNVIPASDFNAENTVKSYIDNAIANVADDVSKIPVIVNDYQSLLSSTADYVLVQKNDSPLGDGNSCLFKKSEYTQGTYKREDGSYVEAVALTSCNYGTTIPRLSLGRTIGSYVGRENLPYGQGSGPFNKTVLNMIDCSSFVWCVLGGITYENSRLVRGSDKDNIYGNYVGKYIIDHDTTPYPGYYGALPTYWSAEYFAEQHQLFAFRDGGGQDNVRMLQAGDVLFSASGTYPEHYHGIDHCMIVLETFPDDGSVLIAESGSAPHTIRALQSTNCKLAYINLTRYSGPEQPYKFFARPNYVNTGEQTIDITHRVNLNGVVPAVAGSSSVILGTVFANKKVKKGHLYTIVVEGKIPAFDIDGGFLYASIAGVTEATLYRINVTGDKARLLFIPSTDYNENATIYLASNNVNSAVETTYEITGAAIHEGIVDSCPLAYSVPIIDVNDAVSLSTQTHAWVDTKGTLNVFLRVDSLSATGDVTLFKLDTDMVPYNLEDRFLATVGNLLTNAGTTRLSVTQGNAVILSIPPAYSSGVIRSRMRFY